MNLTKIQFNYSRRFGVEIELNALDNRDFYEFPLAEDELPVGIDYIGYKIHSNLGYPVRIMRYHHTHNNNVWILKPDRSCGIEVCSPVSKGWSGIKSICQVADLFSQDNKISADKRCSFHVHLDVYDCSLEEIAKILTYWIKFEHVFLDSVPDDRKRNKFCRCIGSTDLFEVDTEWNSYSIIRKLGSFKYFTANCEHLHTKNRETLEFRIIESEACLNSFLIKNWLKLLIHFAECARKAKIPDKYNSADSWTGFCWLELEDFFNFLGFMDNSKLSEGMKQVRDWFLIRIHDNIASSSPGMWSEAARKITKEQTLKLINQLDVSLINNSDSSDLVYSNKYKS